VTQEQYAQVIGSNPSHFKGKDNPVEMVSWNDAQTLCKKLRELTHQIVRLPTEAEWEYACRAGTTSTYYSGDAEEDLARIAWYSENSKNTSHPVGQKEPNAFGLYDMHGDVWQWCQDWCGNYSNSPSKDPSGPSQGKFRVLRGGYGLTSASSRDDRRNSSTPQSPYWTYGLRVLTSASNPP
jgi:formylglycine-generating enzyme required for sulfatase activity